MPTQKIHLLDMIFTYMYEYERQIIWWYYLICKTIPLNNPMRHVWSSHIMKLTSITLTISHCVSNPQEAHQTPVLSPDFPTNCKPGLFPATRMMDKTTHHPYVIIFGVAPSQQQWYVIICYISYMYIIELPIYVYMILYITKYPHRKKTCPLSNLPSGKLT